MRKPFYCGYCGRRFVVLTGLRRHLRYHGVWWTWGGYDPRREG